MDPYDSQMTIECGISQKSYITYICVQFKLLERFTKKKNRVHNSSETSE
jgi:hypothetical protein